MSDEGSTEKAAAHAAGHRAARNTALLMTGEVIGRLAWFAVFAGLGRAQGEAAVGVFVFAAALVQIAMLAVDLGLDRYLIRTVAGDRDQRHGLFSDVIALKLVLAVPVAAALVIAAQLLGYGGATEATIYILTVAFVLEGLGRTVFGVFTAYESGGPIAVTAIAQRVIAAALGISVLLFGFGVVAVAVCYLIGSAGGLVLSLVLMSRTLGPPRWSPDRRRWRNHARASMPFAAEDVFMVILFRIDAVMLAVMTTEIAVGLYGAAYRIFEATLVIPYALVRAFSAMYVYLQRDSEPTIHGTFGRSIKLALAGLLPLAVGFTILAEPLLRLTFGPEFAAAAGPLRLLAPAVAMLGVVSLSIALITSRRDPRIVMVMTAGVALLNVVLNLILIPPYEASGAAAAMLIAESIFAVATLGLASHTIGGVDWLRMLGGPLSAAAVMIVVMLVTASIPVLAAALGAIAYGATLFAVERTLSPGDVRFALGLVAKLLPGRTPA